MEALKLYILRGEDGKVITSSERADAVMEGKYLYGGKIEKIYYDPRSGRRVPDPEPTAVEI